MSFWRAKRLREVQWSSLVDPPAGLANVTHKLGPYSSPQSGTNCQGPHSRDPGSWCQILGWKMGPVSGTACVHIWWAQALPQPSPWPGKQQPANTEPNPGMPPTHFCMREWPHSSPRGCPPVAPDWTPKHQAQPLQLNKVAPSPLLHLLLQIFCRTLVFAHDGASSAETTLLAKESLSPPTRQPA